MDKLLHIFEKSDQEIKLKNLKGFYITVKELFDNLSCDCSLRKLTLQKKEILNSQLSIIQDIPDDTENYELNISKGYLYLLNNNFENAYKYLSLAIEISQQQDLPYALRASLNYEINKDYFYDLKKSLELNPSSRNNFLFAQALINNKLSEEVSNFLNLTYEGIKELKISNLLSKAIELNPKFLHAYYERGKFSKNRGNTLYAINDFLKCIELDSKYFDAYIELTLCLSELGYIKQELFYRLKMLELEPTNLHYHSKIGDLYYYLSDYSKAIYFYEIFLFVNPNDEDIKDSIEKCKRYRFYNEKKLAVISAFENCDYHSCISIFDEIIDSKFNYSDNFESINSFYNLTMNIYLHSILALNGISMQNPETNKIYLEINNLKESGKIKLEDGLELSNDEKNVDKLLSYQFFYKLGFGKYINKGINEVINLNAHYILWCIINIKHFAVENDILALPQFRNQPLLTLAIEYNLIKNIIIKKWVVKEDDSNFDCRDYLDRDDYDNSFYSKFYNDDLDMDQQSPEFWDSI